MQRSGFLAAAVTFLAGSILVLAVVIARGPGGRPASPSSPPPPSSGTGPAPEPTRVFDVDAMDRDIADQYQEKYGETVQVECPAHQPVVTGTTFTCRVADRSERIQVTVNDDNGDYTWRPISA